MTATVNAGPFVSVGQCFVPTDTNGLPVGAGESNPDAGPSLSYQGDGFLDPRFYVQKDYLPGRNGIVLSHLNSPYILSCDQIPAASAATPVNIAAAQAGTTTTLALATASAGISTAVPFYPFKSAALTSAPIAIDLGFTAAAVSGPADTLSINGTATATASSALALSNFYVGQWLYIANGTSATVGLFTQVTAVNVANNTITLSPAPAATTTTAMCASCNIPNTSWIGNPIPTAVFPYLAGGIGGFLDPKQSIMRGVGVNAAAGATATTCTIAGWDIYGQPQTEAITISAGATVYGNKTWKFIASATLNAADAGHNYSVGTSDLFGFVVRTDRWEYTNIFWNGAFVASAVSAAGAWLGGDLTNPATTTTKDVRGVFQPSARGPLATAAGSAANGSIRLALFTSLPLYNVISATPSNPTPLYGVKPV